MDERAINATEERVRGMIVVNHICMLPTRICAGGKHQDVKPQPAASVL